MLPKNLSLIQEADELNENTTESIINKSQLQMVLGSQFNPSKLSPRGLDQFNLSYEMSPTRDGGLTRVTVGNRMNESWAANNISRITGMKMEQNSGFIDDSKMMELLQNEDGQDVFEEIDMGQIDEGDRPYLLVDKDSGRVYDMRNENHLKHLNEKQSKLTTDLNTSNAGSTSNKAWSDWWKQKHQNNQDYLIAAENGNVDEIRRLLDKEKLQELAAEINHKGLDCWTGLHFAANEGMIEVIRELLSYGDVEVEC